MSKNWPARQRQAGIKDRETTEKATLSPSQLIITDHLRSARRGWQGMPTLPPLQGVQILYMQSKKSQRARLCHLYYIHHPLMHKICARCWGGKAFLVPKCLPLHTVFYLPLKTLQLHRHDRPQLTASSFLPCYHSLLSVEQLGLQTRAEQN